MRNNTFSFTVHVVVKGEDEAQAQSFLIMKMNEWFLQDTGKDVAGEGFPMGSLLFWNIHDKVDHRVKSELIREREEVNK